MGALSSEILHFLKVKLSLQNDKRCLPLLSWFQKVYNSRNEIHTKVGSTSLICDLLAKDLLYPLSVKNRAGKDQDPVKMLENSMLICSLFLLEFQ